MSDLEEMSSGSEKTLGDQSHQPQHVSLGDPKPGVFKSRVFLF